MSKMAITLFALGSTLVACHFDYRFVSPERKTDPTWYSLGNESVSQQQAMQGPPPNGALAPAPEPSPATATTASGVGGASLVPPPVSIP